MQLSKKLERKAREMGAAYFGIADLSLAQHCSITPHEEKVIAGYPVAISIGVPLSSSIVDSIAAQSDIYAIKNYYFHVYEVTNPYINEITLCLARIIEEEGFKAVPIPSSQTIDAGKFYGFFSHKMAASLAGLGWIGKSCLLITPDRGPRVRWGTILTDAMLIPGKLSTGKGCGGCKLCVEACPAHAFTGNAFQPSEAREIRMDAEKCFNYLNGERKNIAGVAACGMCVYICPFGKK